MNPYSLRGWASKAVLAMAVLTATGPILLIIADVAKGYTMADREEPTEVLVTETGLRVERTHRVDAGELDARGTYDYYYEYDIYRFSQDQGAEWLAARVYADTPREASFLNLGANADGAGRLLRPADLQRPLFQAACVFLRARGITDLQWLSGRGNGYEAVPTERQSDRP